MNLKKMMRNLISMMPSRGLALLLQYIYLLLFTTTAQYIETIYVCVVTIRLIKRFFENSLGGYEEPHSNQMLNTAEI